MRILTKVFILTLKSKMFTPTSLILYKLKLWKQIATWCFEITAASAMLTVIYHPWLMAICLIIYKISCKYYSSTSSSHKFFIVFFCSLKNAQDKMSSSLKSPQEKDFLLINRWELVYNLTACQGCHKLRLLRDLENYSG